MKRNEIWSVEIDNNFDMIKFVEDLSNKRPVNLEGCSIEVVTSPAYTFKKIFIEELMENGITAYLEKDILLEHVITPNQPISCAEKSLITYLSNIGIDQELIIIDPYFYVHFKNKSDLIAYAEMIKRIISPFASTLNKLQIVTLSYFKAFDSNTKQTVEDTLLKEYPGLTINHQTTNEVHDRFWISNNRSKGVLVGTSLNGLSKKYAVIDYLDKSDVATIVTEFKTNALIQ